MNKEKTLSKFRLTLGILLLICMMIDLALGEADNMTAISLFLGIANIIGA